MTTGITVKTDLIIFDSEELWEPIRKKIVAEYGVSHLFRWVSRRELGFTVRLHQHWITINKNSYGDDITPRRHCQNQVHLDFFSNPALTWFQLKYL
jgi:hypothetical protein